MEKKSINLADLPLETIFDWFHEKNKPLVFDGNLDRAHAFFLEQYLLDADDESNKTK